MRVPDWEKRLIDLSKNAPPFEWGVSDCALWAANWVRDITGRDIAEAFRGHYSSPKGSIRALKRYGAGSLAATMSDLLPVIAEPSDAGRGDLVGVAGAPHPILDCAVGICVGTAVMVYGPDETLVHLPLGNALYAWRVD